MNRDILPEHAGVGLFLGLVALSLVVTYGIAFSLDLLSELLPSSSEVLLVLGRPIDALSQFISKLVAN